MTQKLLKLKKKLTDDDRDKYITTLEFNILAARVFTVRLPQAYLITEIDFDDKVKSLNQKTNSNKTKHLLIENEMKKLQTCHSIYFRGKIHFEEDSTQMYLVFQPMCRYFKRVVNYDFILEWKSKGWYDENIKSPSALHDFLNIPLNYLGTKARARFSGSCLKQDKTAYIHGKMVNIYIVYEMNKNDNTSGGPPLENCLFDTVSLTKNADIDKCKYSGYGIAFDRHGFYSHHSGGTGRNVMIFRVDMSSSTKIDNKKKIS